MSYRHAGQEKLSELQRAALQLTADGLRLASQALAKDPSQLPGQLLGRLLPLADDQLAPLLAAAGDARTRPWLRPLRSTLRPPGGLEIRLEGHEGTPRAVAVSANGSHAASSGNSTPDQTVRLWDLDEGRELHTLRGAAEAGGVTPVALNRDGSVVLIGDRGRVDAVAVDSGRRIWTPAQRPQRVACLAVAAAAPVAVAVWTDGVVTAWDLETRRTLTELSRGHTARASLSPDGRLLAVAVPSGLELVDVASGITVSSLAVESQRGDPVCIAMSADRVYFGPPLRAWILATGELQSTDADAQRVLAVAADGRALEAPLEGPLVVHGPQGRRELPALRGRPSVAAITPDGRRAVVADYEHGLNVFDLDRETSWRGPGTGAVDAIMVSADGRLAVARSVRATTAWSTTTGERTESPPALREAEERWERQWELDAELESATGIAGATWARTPDGRHAIGTTWDGNKYNEDPEPDAAPDTRSVPLWHAAGGLTWLEGHSAPVVAVAVTPDGRHAASASFGRVIRVWDLESNRQTRVLRGHSGIVWGLAAFPDSRRLASASDDGTVIVWEIDGAQRIAAFTGDFPMHCCAVDPSGQCVAAGDDAGGVHVLRLVG